MYLPKFQREWWNGVVSVLALVRSCGTMTKLLRLLLVVTVISDVTCQTIITGSSSPNGLYVPASPCPGTFDYAWWSNQVVGLISVMPPQRISSQEPIVLTVTLAIEGQLAQSFVGQLELAESKNNVVQTLLSGDPRPILYRVRFPVQSPLPKLSSVEVNDLVICASQPVSVGGQFTIITLSHTLVPEGVWSQNIRPTQRPANPQKPSKQPTIVKPQPQNPWQEPEQPWQKPQPLQPQTPPTEETPWWLKEPTFSSSGTPPPTQKPIVRPPTPSPQPKPVSPPTRPARPKPTNVHVTIGQNLGMDDCGQPIGVVVPLVQNGAPSAKGQWPWLAAIFIKTSVGQDFQCGGSLVSTSHVVTAAHCIKDPNKPAISSDTFIVIVGKYNLRRAEPESEPRDISRVVMHPGYANGKFDNDIAIMILESPVTITASVRPVCLWPEGQQDLSYVVNKKGTVVGWGKDEQGNRVTDIPKMVNMPLVSQEECLRSHRNYYYLTSDNTYCAGGRDGAGPCNGDSGGGMYFKERGSDGSSRWMLRGVVSLSLQDEETRQCDLNNYIVFTDVAKYLQWMKSVIGQF